MAHQLVWTSGTYLDIWFIYENKNKNVSVNYENFHIEYVFGNIQRL